MRGNEQQSDATFNVKWRSILNSPFSMLVSPVPPPNVAAFN